MFLVEIINPDDKLIIRLMAIKYTLPIFTVQAYSFYM